MCTKDFGQIYWAFCSSERRLHGEVCLAEITTMLGLIRGSKEPMSRLFSTYIFVPGKFLTWIGHLKSQTMMLAVKLVNWEN